MAKIYTDIFYKYSRFLLVSLHVQAESFKEKQAMYILPRNSSYSTAKNIFSKSLVSKMSFAIYAPTYPASVTTGEILTIQS